MAVVLWLVTESGTITYIVNGCVPESEAKKKSGVLEDINDVCISLGVKHDANC